MKSQPNFQEKQSLCATRRLELIEKATPSELRFMAILDKIGVDYCFQKGFIQGENFCIVDFYIPKPHKLCIEIDGGYHKAKKQVSRDFNRTFYLEQQRKFRVVRFTNEEVDTLTQDEVMLRCRF